MGRNAHIHTRLKEVSLVKKPYDWEGGAILEDHSKRKHKILKEYFKRYLEERLKNPMTGSFRLALVEGFSGGGRYSNGEVGSPILLASTLLATVNEINALRAEKGWKLVHVKCLMFLNDASQVATHLLQSEMAETIAEAMDHPQVDLEVEFSTGLFEDKIRDIVAKIREKRFHNVLYNLDPCGHSHVSRQTLTTLITSEKSVEIFLTYMVDSLVSFLSQTDPASVADRLRYLDLNPRSLPLSDDICSKTAWLGNMERLVFDAFKESAPFMAPFSINNPKGWRYWFMHFASRHRARQVYNDVLHDNSSQQAHFGRSGLRMLEYDPSHEDGSLYLFDQSSRNTAKAQLPDDIPRLISDGGDTIVVEDFYRSIYNQTPAHSDDIHAAIFENSDLEVLTEKGNPRRHPHTISSTDCIRIKKQLSFYLPPLKK